MRFLALKNPEKERLLRGVFSAAGITLSASEAEAFLLYEALLTEKNQVMNLTAITEPSEIYTKHFLDSVMLWKELAAHRIEMPETPSVIDVGSGAGFPGLPLKIMRPEISLTLLDAIGKRVDFLKEVSEALSLSGVQCVHSRSEDAAAFGRGPLREQFDLVVSRAVSAMPVLSEYCLPFVKVGGLFAAYKSGAPEEELLSGERAIRVLGGELEDVLSYSIPGTELGRSLILIRKREESPGTYPRKAGKPEKKPLL